LSDGNRRGSLLDKCKQEDSLNEFLDSKFDKENGEQNRAWSKIMQEGDDDDSDLLWFHRSHPIGQALQQDVKAYVPIPFRVQDGDEHDPDRSKKQVKISNLAPSVQSEHLKHLFNRCCNGRYEKVYVPSECGKCCTRFNCSGRWKDCEDPVPRGFAYITFHNHQHANNAIDMFDGHGLDNLIMSVTWARAVDAPATAPVNPVVKHECTKVTKAIMVNNVKVPSDFQFEGKIKALNGGPRGKLSMGVIELSPDQLQFLYRHPLWQDGFKSDVFWHRNDCINRETRCKGEMVTFTVIVGSSGDGMQAQHVVKK
jgi:hypothetical protein